MKMSDSRPEQLIHAEELMYNGKVEGAFEIVINFEKLGELTSKDRLSALLLKGNIYYFIQQLKEAVEIGERAYPMSQELGLVPESIEALILKAYIVFLGNPDQALNLTKEAEKLLNSLSDEVLVNITKLKLALMSTEAWVYSIKNDFNIALNLALEALILAKKIKHNVMVGFTLYLIGDIYIGKGEYDTALEYIMKSLKIFEKIDFQAGLAITIGEIGRIYYLKGDLNRALESFKRSLSIEKISNFTKAFLITGIGFIYRDRGELNKALKYTKQSTKLAEESLHYRFLIVNKYSIGGIYMMMGENYQAERYYEQSLALSEKFGNTFLMVSPLLYLILINLDNNSPKQAQKYLKRLENLSNQYESTIVKHGYPLGKALTLKASNRMRDKVKAEELLKQIIEDDIFYPQFHILAIVSFCDLLLEELSIYNDPEVLDEINPLITQLLKIAENQHSFSWLAEGKLLQAKLALIQMNIEEAKRLLTEGQNTAESHGLSSLAQKISDEHDNLLEQSNAWHNLKEKRVPISERIELASVDSVINRLQGKSSIKAPELVDEQPTLLLIIAEGGALLFSHKFVEEFSYEEDILSGFLTAFTTFSEELFSKGLDRAKFGEDTILMESVEQFSVCYIFRGQTYPAMQKLSQFTSKIKNSIPILQTLDKLLKTSQVLELEDEPLIGSLIKDIFINQNLELKV